MAARSDAAESESGSIGLPDCGDAIDVSTFEQILEMDDDEEEREFSRSIVYGFFDQAENTFKSMQNAISAGDLKVLSSLGHFLKGSSATLGLTKVKDSCEKIQHYGAHKDEHGNDSNWSDGKLLALVRDTLVVVQSDYKEVERALRTFYGEK